jgi:hypothetical protein
MFPSYLKFSRLSRYSGFRGPIRAWRQPCRPFHRGFFLLMMTWRPRRRVSTEPGFALSDRSELRTFMIEPLSRAGLVTGTMAVTPTGTR